MLELMPIMSVESTVTSTLGWKKTVAKAERHVQIESSLKIRPDINKRKQQLLRADNKIKPKQLTSLLVDL